MEKRMKFIRSGVIAILVAMIFTVVPIGSVQAAYDTEVSHGVVVVGTYFEGAYMFLVDSEGYEVQNEDGSTYVYKKLGDRLWSYGSGFFVGESDKDPQYLATNCHVVDTFLETEENTKKYIDTGYNTGDEYRENYKIYLAYKSCTLRVYYDEKDYEEAFVVDHGDRDKRDLAILKINEPTDKRKPLRLAETSEDMLGETVNAVGFPGNSENEYSDYSKFGENDVTVTKGAINRFVTQSGTGVKRIQIDATIQHGNSGGPLVTEEGNVIGINTNGWGEDGEISYYAINASELVSMLDTNKIPYEMAGKAEEATDVKVGDKTEKMPTVEKPDKTDKNSSYETVGIVVMVWVLIIAVIVVLVIIKKRKPAGNLSGKTNGREKKIVGYDPKTGTPIYEVEKKIVGYDPKTGVPIYEAEKKIVGYNPETGEPIYEVDEK